MTSTPSISALLASIVAAFTYPVFLAVAGALPVVVMLLLLRRSRNRRARLARLGTPSTVARLLSAPLVDPLGWRMGLLGAAAVSAGVALAGPRWGVSHETVQTVGADVVIAVDASLSMLAPDEAPSRLERAKEDVRRLRALSPGDRTALLAFAGRSYILTPLTADDGAIDLFLDNLDPSIVGEPGTSLSRAIGQATDLLLAAPSASDRAIVVLSDGEAFEDEADIRREAERAAANHVSLVMVGYGGEAGSTIPLPPKSPGDAPTLKRDMAGQVVITRYTPALLAAAAEAAHGTFIPASATDKAGRIHQALAQLRTARRVVDEANDRTPRFELFLVVAVLLLVLDTLLVERPLAGRAPLRRPAMAAVAVALLAPVTAHGQLNTQRDTARARATYHDAVARETTLVQYGHAVAHGDHSPRALYNYGTALLAMDSLEAAIGALTPVAQGRDPQLRDPALFNLGLAYLRRGLAAHGADARPDLAAALDAYKRLLLNHPADRDAVWNYELALRRDHPGGGGGGGGSSNAPPSAAGKQSAPQSAPAPQAASALDRSQADALLSSAAREERDVAGQSQRQNAAQEPPEGKDW